MEKRDPLAADAAAFSQRKFQLCQMRRNDVSKLSVLAALFLLAACGLSPCFQISAVQAQAKKPKIVVTFPDSRKTLVTNLGWVDIALTVSDPEITRIHFKIDSKLQGAGDQLVINPGQGDYVKRLPLFGGANTILLYAGKGSNIDENPSAKLMMDCGPTCGFPQLPAGANVPPLPPAGGTVVAPSPSTSRNIVIKTPGGTDPVKDVSSVDSTIVVQRSSGTQNLVISVYNNGQLVDQKNSVPVQYLDERIGIVTTKLKVASGKNEIRVFDPRYLTDKAYEDFVVVNCAGESCGKGDPQLVDTVGNLVIKQPPSPYQVNAPSIESYVAVAKKSQITKIQYQVIHGGKTIFTSDPIVVPNTDETAILNPRINILKGTNTIRFFDADKPGESKNEVFATVTCEGDKCKAVEVTAKKEGVKITTPGGGTKFQDETFIASKIVVQKTSGIKNLFIRVLNKDKPIEQDPNPIAVPQDEDAPTLRPKIRIGEGTNVITVFDADRPLEESPQDSTEVTCDGELCGTENNVATIVTNSLNTRVVVGLEQIGASSTDSQMKPFVDFFFNAPLFHKPHTDELPRVATWGQIRLSATPEQTSAFGVFPSNLVNQVGAASNSTGLVQSFDFLAGFEARLFGANKRAPSLIPGVKQSSSFYFTVGGGAITPLSTTRQNAQIWKVPAADSSQRALFVERFGEVAANKPFIAFVLPERDRFLRQVYAGIRLKTFFYDRHGELINRFPGMLDFMVGQNEAVTGGSLKHDVKDSAGNVIGRRRSYVLRLDGFYPLPFKEASFLYLYGTALMKIGNGGVRVNTPLFLDQAGPEIFVTNKDVFIERVLQDRDYYKIGVGINLTELFNRRRPIPE